MYIYIHTSSDLYKAPHMPASLPPSCPPPPSFNCQCQ